MGVTFDGRGYCTAHFSGAWQKYNSDCPSTYTEDTLVYNRL